MKGHVAYETENPQDLWDILLWAGTLMYYILTHHFYCDFCHMKKYRRHKSYGSGLLGEADELVCENPVYT